MERRIIGNQTKQNHACEVHIHLWLSAVTQSSDIRLQVAIFLNLNQNNQTNNPGEDEHC